MSEWVDCLVSGNFKHFLWRLEEHVFYSLILKRIQEEKGLHRDVHFFSETISLSEELEITVKTLVSYAIFN
jgi:hypothetical protein